MTEPRSFGMINCLSLDAATLWSVPTESGLFQIELDCPHGLFGWRPPMQTLLHVEAQTNNHPWIIAFSLSFRLLIKNGNSIDAAALYDSYEVEYLPNEGLVSTSRHLFIELTTDAAGTSTGIAIRYQGKHQKYEILHNGSLQKHGSVVVGILMNASWCIVII